MSAIMINGKILAAELNAAVTKKAHCLEVDHGITCCLAVILVGEDSASQIYVRNKSKQAIKAGIKPIDFKLPEGISELELISVINDLNRDANVHGILVQLPLPKQINSDNIQRFIDPNKDVDGFHPLNVGYLNTGRRNEGFIPCTPLGCITMLKQSLPDMRGKNAVIIGRSNIVGKPMSALLLQEDCTVTIAHSKSEALQAICKTADILVAAVGQPEIVRGSWIKPGATIIDVGINRLTKKNGQTSLVGDVAFEEAKHVARAITPVPGGVGPMTIVCLLANTVSAASLANNLPAPDWL
ncbi:MAG TPA: Bifunctional protein FolD protein [Hyphomicrobiaceae bacterium MAG_BT-2024]